MRSWSARLLCAAVAWITLGAAGYLAFSSHRQLQTLASGVRVVDQHAREAADTLAELRVSQQAYVASGQGVAFWMPKVAATSEAVSAALSGMRETATTPAGRTAIEEAVSAMAEFAGVDKRARDYVRSGQTLMAADVIFTEGGQLATVAARQVEAARQAELQSFDEIQGTLEKRQAQAAGVAAGVAALIALVLAVSGGSHETAESPAETRSLNLTTTAPALDEGVVSHARPAATVHRSSSSGAPARNAVVLKAAADLATDFGRARDTQELERLLARAADLMDAGGLVVWIGSTAGADLRPVLAHGYTAQAAARMPAVARSEDNAAAAAYRSGTLQIVLSRPGGSAGAIVAPILTADGCVGALSAEIKGGGEGSEAVQAVAAIVAAHLAGVLAIAPAETASEPEAKAAQA
jgi:hypothetical protein